jgi:(p)ppGpp synthase/HD superfamily hydrolase
VTTPSALLAPPQTNIRLYNDLLSSGYPDADIHDLRAAYDLAARLFTSRFRGSGKPFLAHVVGTAGILGSLQAPGPVVAAGLLHAAYTHGDFGDGGAGISDAKRALVRRGVGDAVEALVARYTALPWEEPAARAVCGRVSTLSVDDRAVLLMRLANELEDHVDRGILYCGDAEHRRQLIRAWLHLCVDLAEELGQPALGAALREVFRSSLGVAAHPALVTGQSISHTLPPASYRPRLLVRLRRALARRG